MPQRLRVAARTHLLARVITLPQSINKINEIVRFLCKESTSTPVFTDSYSSPVILLAVILLSLVIGSYV